MRVVVDHGIIRGGGPAQIERAPGSIAGRFARVEPRRTASAVVSGPSKNCRTLSEDAASGTPDKVQRLLTRAVWDDDGVRDDPHSSEASWPAAEQKAVGAEPAPG